MSDPAFHMVIEDVFRLTGRPFPIVRGSSYEGDTKAGASLDLISPDGSRRSVVVLGIELVCRPGIPPVEGGDLSLALGDVTYDLLYAGQVLASR